MRAHPSIFLVAILWLAPAAPAMADGAPQVQPEWVHLSDQLHMLAGAGGNLAVLTGEDGTWVVDSGYADVWQQTHDALRSLRDEPARVAIATHWHYDHVGGFEGLGREGAVLVAHENIRARMATEQNIVALDKVVPASPGVALPTLTFDEALTLHANGEVVHVVHVPLAHTDGDTIVHFRTADVIATGDLFFHPCYPFIDVGAGGTIDGMIAGVEAVLARCGEGTRLIPGHGPLASVDDLRAYRDMLVSFRGVIAAELAAGKTLEQIQAARPTADLDAKWGGCFTPEEFTRFVVASLQGS